MYQEQATGVVSGDELDACFSAMRTIADISYLHYQSRYVASKWVLEDLRKAEPKALYKQSRGLFLVVGRGPQCLWSPWGIWECWGHLSSCEAKDPLPLFLNDIGAIVPADFRFDDQTRKCYRVLRVKRIALPEPQLLGRNEFRSYRDVSQDWSERTSRFKRC